MSSNPETVSAYVQIQADDGVDAEELDDATRQLRDELLDLVGVEQVHLARAGHEPVGAKATDPVTLGALALVILPTVLPKFVDFLQAWMQSKKWRTIKFKGTVEGNPIEFEGSADGLRALLPGLKSSGKRTELPD